MSFPNDVIIYLAKDVSVYSYISPMWFGHLGLHHLGFRLFLLMILERVLNNIISHVYKNEYQNQDFLSPRSCILYNAYSIKLWYHWLRRMSSNPSRKRSKHLSNIYKPSHILFICRLKYLLISGSYALKLLFPFILFG